MINRYFVACALSIALVILPSSGAFAGKGYDFTPPARVSPPSSQAASPGATDNSGGGGFEVAVPTRGGGGIDIGAKAATVDQGKPGNLSVAAKPARAAQKK